MRLPGLSDPLKKWERIIAGAVIVSLFLSNSILWFRLDDYKDVRVEQRNLIGQVEVLSAAVDTVGEIQPRLDSLKDLKNIQSDLAVIKKEIIELKRQQQEQNGRR